MQLSKLRDFNVVPKIEPMEPKKSRKKFLTYSGSLIIIGLPLLSKDFWLWAQPNWSLWHFRSLFLTNRCVCLTTTLTLTILAPWTTRNVRRFAKWVGFAAGNSILARIKTEKRRHDFFPTATFPT